MDLYDVMTTTFASRDFTDDPLPDDPPECAPVLLEWAIDDDRRRQEPALLDGTRAWIITEADRFATTILLPEEY